MNGDISDVVTGAKAQKKVRAGINKVYNALKLTLGPEGQNALLPRSFNRGPRITNDGVTVSENIKIDDAFERLAADAFKEGSKKTNETVGDGTTTTCVLAGHLYNTISDELNETELPTASLEGVEPTKKGVRAIRKEMKEAKDAVIAEIEKRTKKIDTLEDLKKISVISIGKEDEDAANTVAEMVWEIGRDEEGNFVDNHVDVTEGFKGEIETEIVKGMRFPAKVAHRAFVNKPERFEMVADDVKVLITNYTLDNPHEMVAVLNKMQEAKVAIFAPSFSQSVLTVFTNSIKNGIFCYPVKCPALRTEQLEDLAAYTGATVIDKDGNAPFGAASKKDLGFAEKITVKDTENREDAVLMGGAGSKTDRVKERIETLKGQQTEAQNELTKLSIERRIANLQSAVGVIRVGASTNAELLFLKLKIEDGVFACKAALEEGFVKGGGLCLKEIAEEMKENILTQSLKEPHAQIQRNAGGTIEIGEDVIDPAKVVRLVVEHAVSIVSNMITIGILVAERRDKTEYEGNEMIAKAIAKNAFYTATHHNLLKEAEDDAEADREKAFEQALFEAEKD